MNRIPVKTVRRRVGVPDPLAAYLALAEAFGRRQVYLLESAEGPLADVRHQYVGFGELLAVSVTRGRVTVSGLPVLRQEALRRIRPLLGEDGATLPDRRALWPVLRAVESAFDAERSAAEFAFGFFGYLGYDTAGYIEELPRLITADPGVPDVHLAVHQGLLAVDRVSGRSELLVHQSPAWPALDVDDIAGLLRGARLGPPGPLHPAEVADDTRREEFLADVARCLDHIAIGDIYQVQIGHELAMRSRSDPVDVYRRLRARNPSPYMYLAPLGEHTVVGSSPELFVRVENGTAVMRPIAGTARRGIVPDEEAAAQLRGDPKELAEHTMLVDLCRNDLGRICRADSLQVTDLFAVERYSHVLHLVSTVTARVADGFDAYDVIAALFPAGTMTGAPKIRAMEIIEDVERSRRGLYAGALGLIGAGGAVNLALCIRTLVHRDGVYRARASAGVVADSAPDREWNETLAKLSAAHWAVTGKELL
ncbi:anthranilate synthase component I family protein [Thermoactinospora rubra]|uniref:anthranilate synthase component I family protein n=1 Tax=Thermoactinospora rubra TaxID=1088767 RepID=UPI000A10CEF1|nr:anthranilate synthase component I family protein [Thermoactinospora rubra]